MTVVQEHSTRWQVVQIPGEEELERTTGQCPTAAPPKP